MSNQEPLLFNFENEYKNNLHFIPLNIRYKLDRVGLKIGLDAWLKLTVEERFDLLKLPLKNSEEENSEDKTSEGLDSQFKNLLNAFLLRHGGFEAKPIPPVNPEIWSSKNPIPDCIIKSMDENSLSRENLDWNSLSEIKRFILWKLALSARQRENFPQAFAEFCE